MEETHKTYLPAAGHDWLLPLYDPIVKLLGGEAARRALLDQACIRPGQRVLDIGCGTGSLVVLIKRLHPDVDVVGLDPDPKALARGRRKAARTSVSVQFDQGFADELPYADASVDRVFSSFMFHHLSDVRSLKCVMIQSLLDIQVALKLTPLLLVTTLGLAYPLTFADMSKLVILVREPQFRVTNLMVFFNLFLFLCIAISQYTSVLSNSIDLISVILSYTPQRMYYKLYVLILTLASNSANPIVLIHLG